MRLVLFYQKFHFYDGAGIEEPDWLVKHFHEIAYMIKVLVKATIINNGIREYVAHAYVQTKRSYKI